jgi:hypothetical protein
VKPQLLDHLLSKIGSGFGSGGTGAGKGSGHLVNAERLRDRLAAL